MAAQLALVTGASSGIGYNLAKVFAENGFDLIIAAEGDGLNKAAADFSALGAQVKSVQVDLSKYEEVKRLWSEVEALGRPVDAAALNAGVGVGGLFWETDLDQEINICRLNVESTVHLSKYVVKHMVQNGQGRILITSSIAGEMVAPREAVYAASKAFDLSFAKSLRAELEDKGVTVTALQPGPTATNFFHRAGMDNTDPGQEGKEASQPYEMAKQGYAAMMNGDKHVYGADLKTKIEGAMANLVPDALKAKMHDQMAKPLDQK